MFKKPDINSRNIISLTLLLTIVTIVVASTTLFVLYRTAFAQQSKLLIEIAKSQARTIEAIANYSIRTNIDNAFETTMHQIKEAHANFKGFGDTGEFTLAIRQEAQIVYLLSLRHGALDTPNNIEFESDLAEPMRRALMGKSGTMVGYDYRGTRVLAAYEPLAVFKLGVVAKIDLDEFEKPFVHAGFTAAATGFIFIMVSILLLIRISSPIARSASENASKLQTILDTVVDGILTIDEHGQILSMNPAAEKMFCYTKEAAIGHNVNMLVPTPYWEQLNPDANGSSDNHAFHTTGRIKNIEGLTSHGSLFPMSIAISKAKLQKHAIFTAIVRDITEQKRAEAELHSYKDHLEEQVSERTAELEAANKKLEMLARIDGLTGIANRREFDTALSQEIRRAARQKAPTSLLIADIDFFKNYNDTYGHPAGDECLKKVAHQIEKTFQRAGELVARYGGEEFAVILPSVDFDESTVLAQLLRQSIWDLDIPHKSSAIAARVTMSIGVATLPGGQVATDKQMIQYADQALYLAKNNGRNQVQSNLVTKDN